VLSPLARGTGEDLRVFSPLARGVGEGLSIEQGGVGEVCAAACGFVEVTSLGARVERRQVATPALKVPTAQGQGVEIEPRKLQYCLSQPRQ